MAKRHLIIRLLPHEDELLRTLYREFDITIDQYPLRPDDLARLVSTWNKLSGREDTAPDLLHYMISRRKDNKGSRRGWEKLGRKAGGNFKTPEFDFSDNEWKHLDSIHEDFQIASDNYALNEEVGKRLQDEFARRAGRIVPTMILAAAMIRRRKAGALATLKPKPGDKDLGFADIDQVAN